jgi:dephospho-CoA kinase
VKLIGLTGGIASGKTTTHRMLVELGASVLDADAIYHQLLAPTDGNPSPLARAVAGRFPGVLTPEGAIDRRVLGARVFANQDERLALEALTHPAVGAETARRLEALVDRGVLVAFYDVPLLFEAGLDKGMDGIVVVWVPREVQLARLMARDHLDRAAAEARLAAQLPLDEKRRRATWVIDSSGTFDATRAQVERLWHELSPRGG